MLGKLRSLFFNPSPGKPGGGERSIDTGAEHSLEIQSAASLPPIATPNVKNTQRTRPSHLVDSRASGRQTLDRVDLQTANKDLLDYRLAQRDSRQLLRVMSKVTPDLSAAIFAYLRVAITKYSVVARSMDGRFDRAATELIQQMMLRMDMLQNYNDGAAGNWTIMSSAESLGRELLLYGSASIELVLDKARLPAALFPISILDVDFERVGKRVIPRQTVEGQPVNLDIATFFYTSLDQDLKDAYASSPLEAAIQPVLADHDFFNDMRRSVKRAMRPRLDVVINHDRFMETVPDEIKLDPEELKQYVADTTSQIQTTIDALGPEDALVHFDFLELNYLNHGTAQPAQQEEIIQKLTRQRVLGGGKTLPGILGHDTQSQNVASTQSMLFVKNAEGAVQAKIEMLFSQALTLAVRLYGMESVVEFKFDGVDLRPSSELEAFKTMRQSRILEQLSLGLISDDDACYQLTGKLTPQGFAPLSGTRFHEGTSVVENPYSTTGAQADEQGALNRDLSNTPPDQSKS